MESENKENFQTGLFKDKDLEELLNDTDLDADGKTRKSTESEASFTMMTPMKKKNSEVFTMKQLPNKFEKLIENPQKYVEFELRDAEAGGIYRLLPYYYRIKMDEPQKNDFAIQFDNFRKEWQLIKISPNGPFPNIFDANGDQFTTLKKQFSMKIDNNIEAYKTFESIGQEIKNLKEESLKMMHENMEQRNLLEKQEQDKQKWTEMKTKFKAIKENFITEKEKMNIENNKLQDENDLLQNKLINLQTKFTTELFQRENELRNLVNEKERELAEQKKLNEILVEEKKLEIQKQRNMHHENEKLQKHIDFQNENLFYADEYLTEGSIKLIALEKDNTILKKCLSEGLDYDLATLNSNCEEIQEQKEALEMEISENKKQLIALKSGTKSPNKSNTKEHDLNLYYDTINCDSHCSKKTRPLSRFHNKPSIVKKEEQNGFEFSFQKISNSFDSNLNTGDQEQIISDRTMKDNLKGMEELFNTSSRLKNWALKKEMSGKEISLKERENINKEKMKFVEDVHQLLTTTLDSDQIPNGRRKMFKKWIQIGANAFTYLWLLELAFMAYLVFLHK